MEMKFDYQSSPTNKSDNEHFFINSQYQESYSIAKSRVKDGQKALERYRFKDVASCALVVEIHLAFKMQTLGSTILTVG
jgi:hypothetical protein